LTDFLLFNPGGAYETFQTPFLTQRRGFLFKDDLRESSRSLKPRKESKRPDMEVTIQEDLDPDVDFYYRRQFEIYHEPYLIWEWGIWGAVMAACTVYRIEVDGEYAGDVILEGRRGGRRYIVDFGLLPEYQGKGIGKAVLEKVKKISQRLTAVTRNEVFGFFLKSGFVVTKKIKNYYHPGVDGYLIAFGE
jgi:ribosomal protein S18 acetylase RimI-like enzyme